MTETTEEILPVDQRKNQIAAGIFAILFWPLGLHKFYLGQVAGGIVYIVLTVLFSLIAMAETGLLFFLVLLWCFASIEAVILLSKPVNKFNEKYNLKWKIKWESETKSNGHDGSSLK